MSEAISHPQDKGTRRGHGGDAAGSARAPGGGSGERPLYTPPPTGQRHPQSAVRVHCVVTRVNKGHGQNLNLTHVTDSREAPVHRRGGIQTGCHLG